ncbi:MAG: polysaccharide deacetylase family protein [Desulfobacterales bacterium]|jgi:peptidoglycan/xylan/chitin deacetylase (PgdA/CDA1 family)|nr:polysaccharide deacetylase family protein [Deltaproteobacteria bacterium]
MLPDPILLFEADQRSNAIRMLFFMMILAACLLFMSACASTQTTTASSQTQIFRSEDYVVYQLKTSQSPAELAEKFLGGPQRAWIIEEANPDIRFRRGNAVVIPLKERNRGGLSADGFQTIPILTYHRFAENCSSPLCMPARTFERQMRYLKDNGYHVITAEELLAFLEYRQRLPRKSVLITMDDGYRSVYDIAYPILQKYGFKATLFIYTSFVGVSKMAITWDQLKEMKANGFTIGSHTIYHSDLTQPKEDETEQSHLARIKDELFGSKKIIDKKMGQNTYFLAYPFGYYDQRSIQIAKQAGYKIAMSVKRGGNAFFANPLTLRRDQILEKDMQTFISRLKTFNPLILK